MLARAAMRRASPRIFVRGGRSLSAAAPRGFSPFLRRRRGSGALAAPVRCASTLDDEYAGAMNDESSGSTHVVGTFRLESGEALRHVGVKYRTWGRLNEKRDNCLLVCHALTGSHELGNWWGGLLGPGKAFDTDKYHVVCINTLGSPYGTRSPITDCSSMSAEPRRGPDFPAATVRDAVALQACVLRDAVGVDEVACVVGGSMGGMLALEFCYHNRPLVRSAALVSTNGRHGAWQIAMNALQRNAIAADPAFKGGKYAADAPPTLGLSLARQVAMVSYRTHNAYATKFGRRAAKASDETMEYDVESYLQYQGTKFNERDFDANCYVYLTKLMDSHDVGRGRGKYPQVLSQVQQPTLVLGVTSDVLYPLHEQQELAIHLGNCQGFHAINSDEGHDGFLLEQDAVGKHLTAFLADQRAASA